MATKRNGLPEVWPSGLAKYLAGEQSCGFQVWFKAHHRKYVKVPTDFSDWNVKHTALLNATAQRLQADGWKCRLENQNYFRLQGQTAILCGKPDIVATRNGVTKVVDAKTGEPRESHIVQVATYMLALPLVWNPKLYVVGEIAYSGHSVEVGPEEAEALRPKVFALLKEIGTAATLPTVPSAQGCAYCDIAKVECAERVEAEAETVKTELF